MGREDVYGQLHSFLTFAPDGDGSQLHALAGLGLHYPLYWELDGPESRCGEEKISRTQLSSLLIMQVCPEISL